MDLKGKIAFITGSAQGLGKAYSEALLENGAKVFLSDVDLTLGSATLKEFEAKFGAHNVRFATLDVTDHKKFTEVFGKAVSEFGRVDIMVNNAGILNEAVWELMISINVTAVVHGTQLATEHMRKDKGGRGGRIINISSTAGLHDFANMPVYCGTKHAVRSFTSALANQPNLNETDIEYGMLCPGATNTELMRKLDDSRTHFLDRIQKQLDESMMPVPTVVEGFLELLQLEKMNGSILRVEKRGRRYQKMESRDV